MNKMTKTMLIAICAMLLESAARAEAETVLQQLQREAGPDAVAATLLVPRPVASEVLLNSPGSRIRWSPWSASCGEYTPDNQLIMWLHRDHCRRSQGSSIRWSPWSASCGEYTPDGHLIMWVHRDHCRRSQGSSIRWSRWSASCGEYTPDNQLIMWVHRDHCRRSQEQSRNTHDRISP